LADCLELGSAAVEEIETAQRNIDLDSSPTARRRW